MAYAARAIKIPAVAHVDEHTAAVLQVQREDKMTANCM